MGLSRINDAAMGGARSAGVPPGAMPPGTQRGAAEQAAAAYVVRPLPISLAKPSVPPWVQDLSRLLDRGAAGHGDCLNLRSVERRLRVPGAIASDLPDEVIRAAGLELRWLARRESPSPALARLLDQFEHQVLQPALRRLKAARTLPG